MLRNALTGVALAALLVSPATAQTVDEVIAQHTKAKGGMEKLKSVKTMRATGKMIMGQGMEAPFVMMGKRNPSSTRIEFTFQGMTGVQAFDGKNAWMIMPFLGKKDPEAMPEEDTKMMAEQADMDGPLVDWKEKGHKVELLGKEQVEGADAYKVKVTMKNGSVRTYYIDAETYLDIKVEAKRKMRGTDVEGETVFGDYKDVDGLMMAHSMENGTKGSPQRQKMVFEKVEVNPTLADSLFAMPAGTKPAAPDTSKGAAVGGSEGAKGDSAKAAAKTGAKARTGTAKSKKP
jgi:outer membrane lipoprotein-sorting protein